MDEAKLKAKIIRNAQETFGRPKLSLVSGVQVSLTFVFHITRNTFTIAVACSSPGQNH
jgi:hypothetical protein